VMEYPIGQFKLDEATLEGELKLAESEWQRAKGAVEFTQERLKRIRAASKGTTADAATEYEFEDFVSEAARREPKAKLAFDQAGFKLKQLLQYRKPTRIKQLQSEVESARSDELTKKAVLELEKLKLDRLQAQLRDVPRTALGKPLAVFARVFALDDEIR